MEQVKEKLLKEIDSELKFRIQYWPIFLKCDDREFVGVCGLRTISTDLSMYLVQHLNITHYLDTIHIFEFGVHIKYKYWHQGYAKEAADRVIAHAFRSLKVVALFAGHNPKNESSRRLLTALGFKYFRDEYYQPTGLYHPSYLLTIEQYFADHNDQVLQSKL